MIPDARKQELAERLFDPLTRAIDELTWLAQWKFLWVEDCKYRDGQQWLIGKKLNGSHPDWEPFEIPAARAYEPAQVYLDAPGRDELLALHPFVVVRSCGECLRDELYVLDRRDPKSGAIARSLRDHKVQLP